VEFQSELSRPISKLAKENGKACIVSYHDFQKTPPFSKLQAIVNDAQEFASIVKISTMVRQQDDISTLNQLLNQAWEVPVCIIGMGAKGTQTRISFPLAGSCMTYGYLDKPSAPGQLPAKRLFEALRQFNAKYNEDAIGRKQLFEYV